MHISVTMHTNALVLVYLACLGDGRRMQALSGHLQKLPVAGRQSLRSLDEAHQFEERLGAKPLAALARILLSSDSTAAFSHLHAARLRPVDSRSRAGVVNMGIPRNLQEMTKELKEAVQESLKSRKSRLAVEMPAGFEFAIENKKAKRKGGMKVLKGDDIIRSDRELAQLFTKMFEKTGLVPLILFPSEDEAKTALVKWDLPGFEAKVKALVPADMPKPMSEKAESSSKGGFGAGLATKKTKAGKLVVTDVPSDEEVVIAVAPGEAHLRLLQEHCEKSGMDKLVILLNARLESEGGAEGVKKTEETIEYFEDGGEGGFMTSFIFNTQPLGVKSMKSKAAKEESGNDPVVLYRRYPQEWLLARKPQIGPPRTLLKRSGDEGRPTLAELKEAVDADNQDGGLFKGFR